MTENARQAFAVWLTGLPSSGKSTIAAALDRQLRSRGVNVAVLESDALRRDLTPQPIFSAPERETFYASMVWLGALIVDHGIAVVFDATANKREYRDRARAHIARFIEVLVDTPLDRCMARDTKGIYRKAQQGEAPAVPGVTAVYEPPVFPELRVSGVEPAERAAAAIVAALESRGYVPAAAV